MATEEQTNVDDSINLSAGDTTRGGQHLVIPNRRISKLSFCLSKSGAPAGNVTFSIRSDYGDILLGSKVWGNANTLTGAPVWYEVTFDSSIDVSGAARILVEFNGGGGVNYIKLHTYMANIKNMEALTLYFAAAYHDYADEECAYIYTYTALGGNADATIAEAKVSLELLRNIEMMHGGHFLIDKDGNAKYESRNARYK